MIYIIFLELPPLEEDEDEEEEMINECTESLTTQEGSVVEPMQGTVS